MSTVSCGRHPKAPSFRAKPGNLSHPGRRRGGASHGAGSAPPLPAEARDSSTALRSGRNDPRLLAALRARIPE